MILYLIYGFGMMTCTVSPLSRFTAHLLPVYRLTNERVGVFLARRSVLHLVISVFALTHLPEVKNLYSEICLSQTPYTMESCINRTLYKVPK
jgi:hypothetical protein